MYKNPQTQDANIKKRAPSVLLCCSSSVVINTFLSTLLLVFVSISAANAQEKIALEEVIVAAQKRLEGVQDVPMAISVFDSANIDLSGLGDVTDISARTPNVILKPSLGGTTGLTSAIRGMITINPSINLEPSVGVYLDGVNIARSVGGLFDVADLAQIEVIKGPQGTLYGKSTTGGAINLITQRPVGKFGGDVMLGAGNFSLSHLKLGIDTPSFTLGSTKLSVRVNYMARERDGWVRNRRVNAFSDPVNDDLNNIDSRAARIALLLELSEDMDVFYAYDQSEKKQNPTYAQLTSESGVYDFMAAHVAEARQSEASVYDALRDDIESEGHTVNFTWALSDNMTFKSISSYRKLDFHDQLDMDGTRFDIYHSERIVDFDQVMQEFQLLGAIAGIKYVSGLHFLYENADVINPVCLNSAEGNSSDDCVFGLNDANRFMQNYGFENITAAVFGQADWTPQFASLQDRLTLSVGVRLTGEEKEQYIQKFYERARTADDSILASIIVEPGQGPIPAPVIVEDTFTNVSPSFAISWKFTNDINVYGRIAKGWKSGGFNGEAPSANEFRDNPFEEEEVIAAELGIKTRFLKDRILLNIAAFQNNVVDMQLTTLTGDPFISSTVANAGEATIQGAELELVAKVIAPLTIIFSYGYLDGVFDEYTLGGVDMSDSAIVPYAPHHSGNLGVEWKIVKGAFGVLSAKFEANFVGEYVVYSQPDLAESTRIDDYWLFNARIDLTDILLGIDSNSLKISLWGKNLDDEDYRLNGIPLDYWTVNYIGEPRTYGFDFTYGF